MNIRKLITVAATVGLLASPVAALAFTDSDASTTGFDIGTATGSLEGGIADPSTTGLIDSIIAIINALLVIAAIAAIVFVIIGGVRYVTAQGDEDAVAQAKNTVIYAVIGIIVIILAAVIVNFFLVQL